MDAQAGLEAARRLAAQAWPLGRLAASYDRFNAAFAGLGAWQGAAPLDAMVARTLLIHEYRRIVLQAPDLPVAILPPDWPGTTARALCRAAYAAVLPASEHWLTEQALPAPGVDLEQRFR